MSLVLSAPKTILLAVHLSARADVDGLAYLATTEHGHVLLRGDLLLRILLTYLPETVKSSEYVPLLQQLESGSFADHARVEFDAPAIEELSEEQAARRVRKLRLQQLSWLDAPAELAGDSLSLFLLRRAYRVDEEAGLLTEVPELLAPFLERSPYLHTWTVSVLLPLLRRNYEYYPKSPLPQTVAAFERLPDRSAVTLLLSQTGVEGNDGSSVGRDLRGLIGPWLYNDVRWSSRKRRGSNAGEKATYTTAAVEGPSSPSTRSDKTAQPRDGEMLCPGWEQVLQWLTAQASSPKTWRVAIGAVQHWDGPNDVDVGDLAGTVWLEDAEQSYLERRYARASMASAYLMPEASVDALEGAHAAVTKIASLLDLDDPCPPLQTAASLLSPLTEKLLLPPSPGGILSARNAQHLRSGLLDEGNPLTAPRPEAAWLLHAAVLSAFLLTRAGLPCTARRAAELCLLRNAREQRAEAAKLIHTVGSNGPKSDDKYWLRTRNEILWLRDWGAEEGEDAAAAARPQQDAEAWEEGQAARNCNGVFGQVRRDFLETEILKALLSNTRYSLAQSLYEDAADPPLPRKVLQETIIASAMNAYDNASNPNRTRGGLKKCNDVIQAFPKTLGRSLPATRRIEALLRATHALSEYRLVLKQGEPFTPVVLRVHPDPVSILAKVLEQNPKSYTRLHDLLDLGASMVEAGLTASAAGSGRSGNGDDGESTSISNGSSSSKNGSKNMISTQRRRRSVASPAAALDLDEAGLAAQKLAVERRVMAMCVDAALTEDDFETAYSYVVNRLGGATPTATVTATATATTTAASPPPTPHHLDDQWSWKAALEAGKYRLNPRTVRPPHVGGINTSADAEVRHLEQRVECLSTALRIAPAATLQEILNAYRRCEEELEVKMREEGDREASWDGRGDAAVMPGGFAAPAPAPVGAAARAAGASSFSPAARGSGSGPGPVSASASGAQAEETAPLSLFDLSRATARAASRNFSALSSLQRSGLARGAGDGGAGGGAGGQGGGLVGGGLQQEQQQQRPSSDKDTSSAEQRTRKRDQLRDAAVGTLVSGVGWLVGAQPVDRGGDRD